MSSRRPRRKPGLNRELLIEAGLSEFGLRGYHGASTSTIAKLADVPQPHLYAHFKTKQELFLACLERAAMLIAEAPYAPGLTLPRFLYQSVAATGDEQLSAMVVPGVNVIMRDLGEQVFREVLLLAAFSLLNGEEAREISH